MMQCAFNVAARCRVPTVGDDSRVALTAVGADPCIRPPGGTRSVPLRLIL